MMFNSRFLLSQYKTYNMIYLREADKTENAERKSKHFVIVLLYEAQLMLSITST